jgi:predicted RNA-binding protein YlqC (UPF0109 family)
MILSIAKALVDDPDQIAISEIPGDNTVVISLKVASQDVGKIVGKKGRMANAIRTILTAASVKAKQRTVLEIS